ncbi:TetR family transcriptional regulator [Prauserella sp. PE36]|uniref:TetR/AcrR family transcriptional regulator n=1 Tax=Prauserella endophytica TaxID=1592324 RepID=A0ABY2S5F0_9PSEU|nr:MULTISPECIES: TetR/AcrR family transcriptional regulator [Prauserella]PXY30042.1 TetR family transcriptional regulator [Prauserella coralliicola]RBM12578.1 TetR family transcriptional regulator [Prauserella sp. PE36]TKG71104.1 TetR/AcrR family transcriptional regulator [Prauserella endophytica]
MKQSEPVPAAPTRSRTDRKSQLATIAANLFCERGYHAVGLGDIATEAGITGPAIYKHFRNKQAILAYAAADLASAIEGVLAEVPASGPPWERLDQVVRALSAVVVERRRGVQLYQWERRYLDADDHARFTATITSLVGAIADLLGKARPRLPAADRTTLAAAACSAIASLSTHRTQVSPRVAAAGLRAIALGVLATGLPPRLAAAGNGHPLPAAIGDFVSRRERLLVSALRPFRERGFHAVTMEDIGAAAGIGGSSVYRHFASKGDLLAAVYYRAADRLAVATSTAIEGARDPGEALRRLVDAYIEFSYLDSDLAAVYLSEYGNLPADDRHALRKVQREHVEQWVRLVVAVREDTRTSYARLAVHAALNIVHDLSMARHRHTDADQIKHLVFAALAS